MQAYTDFASVYDTFMDETPYKEWCEYIKGILKEQEIEDGILLELGCGTGSVCELLSQSGFDMIGIDNSAEMLAVAERKKVKSKSNILYLLQDMREFELYGTVKAVVSVCDSINYLLEDEEVKETFRLVNNYLDPGGIFIFDFNTVFKYKEVIGDTVIAENRENCSFIWDNYYYEDEKINEYDLTIFVKEKTDLYRRFQEMHYQRGYELDEMKQFLEETGLEFVTAYEAITKRPPAVNSERIYIVARERGKSKT